ncbi:MAG: right-handed parallel beta-helix repeat-containing protein [Planctomycetota bacterium]
MWKYTIVLLLLAGPAIGSAKDVYVSPNGSDENVGTRKQPFASLRRARKAMQAEKGGTIWLAAGEYHVADGFSLEATDSGTEEMPLVIRSMVPHAARITGAKEVTGFKPIPDEKAASLISETARTHVLVADLKAQGFPELTKLPKRFRAAGCEEVIFDGRPLQSARWPNEGFATFTEVIDAGASDPVHWVTREVYRPGSFRFPNTRPEHWDLSRDVYLHGFWCYDWYDDALRVASYDTETRELRFAAKTPYGVGNPWNENSEREFYALHVFEELDRPGEYYLDRQENKLYLWPTADVKETPVMVSLCQAPLFTASEVAHLILRDLVLENGCDWAARMTNCTHGRIENCIVRNMGLGGIRCHGGNDNHVIECEVTRTGSRAVSMNAGDRKSLTNGNCSVKGSHLHHLGRHDWGGGRGVTLGGCGNRVARNLIHHCPTGAVSYGGNEHILELNEIHDVCELYGDVGVFYTGRDWSSRGNIVRWNYIHHIVNKEGHGSQAIYLDDCDSGDRVVGNIVFGGVGRGVLLGGGRDNMIQGNLFLFLPKGIHVDARGPRGITLDKPGSWNLKAKCEKVGYRSPLWRKRYPKLARILEEQPLLPLGNVMRDNIFIACDEPWALRDEVKEEWLTRENNVQWPATKFPFLPQSAENGELDLAKLPQIWKHLPGFDPIPYQKIGPGRLSSQ